MHPTNSELTVILSCLNKVKSNAEAGLFSQKDVGICYLLDEILCKELIDVENEERINQLHDWAMSNTVTWLDFSGDKGYPVPPQYHGIPLDVSYYQTAIGKQLWKGNQLSLRISLLNHLIQCVNKELEN